MENTHRRPSGKRPKKRRFRGNQIMKHEKKAVKEYSSSPDNLLTVKSGGDGYLEDERDIPSLIGVYCVMRPKQ
ncbi:hypothetical protein TNCV_421981, partial [Trichonephila clavipes]